MRFVPLLLLVAVALGVAGSARASDVQTVSLPAVQADPQWVVLVDDEEAYGGCGPAFPSSSYPDAAVRPQLEVWYMA